MILDHALSEDLCGEDNDAFSLRCLSQSCIQRGKRKAKAHG